MSATSLRRPNDKKPEYMSAAERLDYIYYLQAKLRRISKRSSSPDKGISTITQRLHYLEKVEDWYILQMFRLYSQLASVIGTEQPRYSFVQESLIRGHELQVPPVEKPASKEQTPV